MSSLKAINSTHVFVLVGWVKAVRKSNKKVRMGKKILQPPSHTSCGLKNIYIIVFLLFQVPRLLLDGWSYQDYMSVLGSEDEIEELSSELVDVAKVKRKSVLKYHFCASVCV